MVQNSKGSPSQTLDKKQSLEVSLPDEPRFLGNGGLKNFIVVLLLLRHPGFVVEVVVGVLEVRGSIRRPKVRLRIAALRIFTLIGIKFFDRFLKIIIKYFCSTGQLAISQY